MHTSISSYLTALADKGRSPLTIKAVRGDLVGFATWWEARYSRPFDPALLRASDLHTWRLARQKDDATAPATINRALVTLRAYCDWAKHAGLITENAGAQKLKCVEDKLNNQRLILIALNMEPLAGRPVGWHIMPVVDMDEDNLVLVNIVHQNGEAELIRLPKAAFIAIHENFPGGEDVAYLDE